MILNRKVLAGSVLAGMLGLQAPAHAHLVLTAAGIADGFSLSTFYSDPSTTYGLLGGVSDGSGNIIGSAYGHGQILRFPDVDGQTYGSATGSASAGGTPTGIASSSGNVYVGLLGSGYYQVNTTTLGLTPLTLSTGPLNARYGLWGAPGGNLVAGTAQGVVEINPTSGTWTLIGNDGGNNDGVSVSPNGTVAYVEENGNRILGYSLTSPNPNVPVFDSGVLPGGPDGTGVISGGLLNGDIVVNNNDGTLALIDPTLLPGDPGYYTVVASGGSRGDLVAPDTSNGTLFLTQYEEMQRLSCGPGCAIGSTVPEPSTITVLATALIGLWAMRRRALAASTPSPRLPPRAPSSPSACWCTVTWA